MATPAYGGLTGANRDAAVALTNLFTSYGLGSLAPAIVDFIKQGYSSDTITVLLADTPEYKKRFAANDARIKKGLPALSPAEYLATESAYRQVMSQAGVPKGFYDQPSDFQKWIEGDVSPSEIQTRVQAAETTINSASPETLAYFKKFYSKGDMIAYALDQSRAAPLVGKQFEAARIGGAAAANGVDVGQKLAEELAGFGVNQQQAQAGFGQIAQDIANVNKLASLGGEHHLSTDDLARETFTGDAKIADIRNRLASQERGRFGGTSGVGGGSLAKNSGGL